MPPVPGTPPVDKDGKPMGATAGKAKLIVKVPTDATLYIDDQKMKSTTERRAFSTPELEAGQLYYYMVRVEMVVDGKPVSDSRRVIIRAGQEVEESFLDLAAKAAAKDSNTTSRK
jgi:uncharacterized protein (TIGR03000 family)